MKNHLFLHQCKRWSQGQWITDGCVQTDKPFLLTVGNTTYVECKCTQLGSVGAFATDEPLPTTPVPSTAAPTTKVSQPPAKVQMAFKGDYTAIVAEFGKTTVEAIIKTEIASYLNVNESRITNLTISEGSIVVDFMLLPEPGASSNSELLGKLSLLEQAIKANNVSVTLPDGSVINADPDSFRYTFGSTIAPTTDPLPTVSSGLTETEVIIIAVVCGVVVAVVLVIIVVCCVKKKTRVRKISPRSSCQNLASNNDVEMSQRGRGLP